MIFRLRGLLLHTGQMDADVVVIGAGALGLSTALHCALAGRSVIVLDRHEAGSQASGRAAGLFKSVQADELRTRLARRSIELALSFAGWAGEPLEVERSGSFLLARTPAHADYLRRELAQSAGWGVDLQPVSPARVGEQVNQALKPDNYLTKSQELTDALYANAKPLYEAAYQQFPAVKSQALYQLMNTPSGQEAAAPQCCAIGRPSGVLRGTRTAGPGGTG